MISKISKITGSKFLRNVAIVATGTAGAQAIALFFTPIITRLYGPEVFGLLGSFVAVLMVLTPIAALTYPIAIVLPQSDKDALVIAKLSGVIALVVSLITALVLLTTGGWIADKLNLKGISGLSLLIPMAMLAAAAHQIFTQWLIRKKQFRITARVAVMQAFVVNSAQAVMGWLHPVGIALIVIVTAGHVLQAILLWVGICRAPAVVPNPADGQPASAYELAKCHRDFPLYRAPQVALNALSQSLPVLMLASFFGPAAAGFYALGKTVMGVPSALIGKSVADVFYPRITEAVHRGENLYTLLRNATVMLAGIGLLPFGAVIFFGPWLFTAVFGGEWEKSGEYAQWLAIWLYFGFINRPSVTALATLGLQRFFLMYEVASVFFRTVAIYLGFVVFDNDTLAIALFSIVGVVINSVLVMYTLNKSLKLAQVVKSN